MTEMEKLRASDMRIAVAMGQKTGADKVKHLAMALTGQGGYALESAPGAGHDFQMIFTSIYRFHVQKPQERIDEFLYNALNMIVQMDHNPVCVQMRKSLVNEQAANQENGRSPFRLELKELEEMAMRQPAKAETAAAVPAGEAKETEGVPEVPEAPLVPEKKSASGKGKKLVIAAVSVAAGATLLVGLWCGGYHLAGSNYRKQGEYEKAAAAFEKDFLFGKAAKEEAVQAHREAIMEQGDAYMEAGEYVLAMEQYEQLGEDAAQKWTDAAYAEACRLIDAGSPKEALKYLDLIAGEKRAEEQRGVALLAIARDQIDNGKLGEAEKTLLSITDTTLADPVPMLDEIYSANARTDFLGERYDKALTWMEKCQRDDQAKTDAAILKELKSGDALAAAKQMDASLDASAFTREQWKKAFTDLCRHDAETLEEELRYMSIFGYVDGFRTDNGTEAVRHMYNAIPTDTGIRTYEGHNDTYYAVDNLNELKKQCTGVGTGKLLIVSQCKSYETGKVTYAVMLKMMQKLPVDMIPESLSEVEYMLVLNHSFFRDGAIYRHSNGKNTISVRENGNVSLIRIKNNGNLYIGPTVNGPVSPDRISGINPPAYKSGGCAVLNNQIAAALDKLLK